MASRNAALITSWGMRRLAIINEDQMPERSDRLVLDIAVNAGTAGVMATGLMFILGRMISLRSRHRWAGLRQKASWSRQTNPLAGS